MNLLHASAPLELALLGWLVSVPAVLQAAWSVRGRFLPFSLFVKSGSTVHRIYTLEGGEPAGSGRSTFQPTAQGGRFEITGKDEKGSTLSATIECARFGPIMAVGG